MMVQKNIEMQLQAIRIIQERNGKMLNAFFFFFSFVNSDFIMVLNVAALCKCISNLLSEKIQECKLPNKFVFATSKKVDQNLI